MSNSKLNIVCFGEVLFDVFPDKSIIGGAPLNVALRLASLDINAKIISRIGDDVLGNTLKEYVKENNIATDTIQVDNQLETGQVLVHLDNKGSASYTINYPAAWDRIELDSLSEAIVKESNAFVFGSLVCRDEVSFSSLKSLLPLAHFKVFDVNLRTPFYKFEVLHELMNAADFIKFNDDELFEICAMMKSPYNSLEQNIRFIAENTNTKQICVTKGSHGAVLYINEKLFYNSGFKINVVDTVGSGDSFLAGLLSELLSDSNPQKAIDFGCALGAIVAQNQGANAKISKSEILNFMNPIIDNSAISKK